MSSHRIDDFQCFLSEQILKTYIGLGDELCLFSIIIIMMMMMMMIFNKEAQLATAVFSGTLICLTIESVLMLSYRDSLFHSTCLPVGVTTNKLYLLQIGICPISLVCSQTAEVWVQAVTLCLCYVPLSFLPFIQEKAIHIKLHLNYINRIAESTFQKLRYPRSNNTTADLWWPMREHHLITGITMKIKMHQ